MGREEGGGFRMGNTCIPVADSFWYLAKLIQFVKFKKKNKRVREGFPEDKRFFKSRTSLLLYHAFHIHSVYVGEKGLVGRYYHSSEEPCNRNVVSRSATYPSPEVLERQNLGPSQDLPIENLHFNKIPRWFLCESWEPLTACEDEKSLSSGNKLSTESRPLTQEGQNSAYIG